ncbi:MAG: cell envelope integrity protein TolA [Syntrophaceae bacterium]|nr:cell envelope integrity protein TolA [Syntrophaceae bacterium]
MIGVSLLLHIVGIVVLSLNPWPTLVKVRPTAYTVTLMPISIQEPRVEKPVPPPVVKEEKPRIEKPKKDDIVQKVKKPQKEKTDLKHLQEAIEEIRKKVALDEIQKRVARREKTEERPAIVPPNLPSVSSPKASTSMESKLNQYYSMIWAKIKEAWTIPENMLKEMVDLETVIVIIIEADGKVQRSWFEKRSGNDLYDQMAMRAIRKADPLPPIPKELNEKSLEVGIRFLPD